MKRPLRRTLVLSDYRSTVDRRQSTEASSVQECDATGDHQ